MVRTMLKNFLARWWPYVTLALAKDPPDPPFGSVFAVRPFHKAPSDHLVYVGFFPDNTKLRNKYHTVVIVEAVGFWLVVNSGLRDSLIVPARPQTEESTPERWLKDNKAAFVAAVPASFEAPARANRVVIGPISCTELAKRCIGMHSQTVHTAAELLHYLWCRRVNDE